VAELADFARAWVWGAARVDHGETLEIQREADDIRGILHDALAKTVDGLLTDDVVRRALDEEAPLATRDALDLLAERLTMLRRKHLFDEVPQDALFIKPTVKQADYSQPDSVRDWQSIEEERNGDDIIVAKAIESYGSSRVIVIEGEMGVGKSCLMREVASCLAGQFLRSKRQPVVHAQWRDIYDANDLTEGIKLQLNAQYRLPFHDLDTHDNLVFLIDGFDEMSSHEAGWVASCFHRLVRLAQHHKSTVIVAMRSTVVSETIRNRWKDEDVFVVQVQEFDDEDVDQWAQKWQAFRGVERPSGQDLRAVCDTSAQLVRNPLLLYMVASLVYPAASRREQPLTRAEIFRIFVDETIAGKARQSGESFPFDVRDEYRFLLQEIAWVASWPNNGGKCPESEIRDQFREIISEEFKFLDVRTAFVLHFFEPGQVSNEFEFHPEGFRHYLLAEWCVRTQLEALLYEDEPGHKLGRTRDEAMNALSQLVLRDEERELVNEIYEQLPQLVEESSKGHVPAYRVAALGLDVAAEKAGEVVRRLYERVRRQSEAPKDHRWKPDNKVGFPAGEGVPACMDSTRQLVNYWDHCLLAAFGLYRGLGMCPRTDELFPPEATGLARYLNLRSALRGRVRDVGFDLSRLNLSGLDLEGVRLWAADLTATNLDESNLRWADLRNTIILETTWTQAELAGVDFRGAHPVRPLPLTPYQSVDGFPTTMSVTSLARVEPEGTWEGGMWHHTQMTKDDAMYTTMTPELIITAYARDTGDGGYIARVVHEWQDINPKAD